MTSTRRASSSEKENSEADRTWSSSDSLGRF